MHLKDNFRCKLRQSEFEAVGLGVSYSQGREKGIKLLQEVAAEPLYRFSSCLTPIKRKLWFRYLIYRSLRYL